MQRVRRATESHCCRAHFLARPSLHSLEVNIMTIADTTRVQAYQLRQGGARARMAILRMIACDSVNNFNESTRLQPGDWKRARHWTLKGYEGAYGMLGQGAQDGKPLWSTHNRPEFRDERQAREILRSLPRGWYTDSEGRDTAIGIVSRISHGRMIAGYLWTSNGERVYFPEVHSDEDDAARAADGHAERFAESAREDSERFDRMQLAEIDEADKVLELQKAIALRHRAEFGGFDGVREAIEELRAAREELKTATAAYERG